MQARKPALRTLGHDGCDDKDASAFIKNCIVGTP